MYNASLHLLRIQMHTDEQHGDEVSRANDEIRAELLRDDGREAAGEARRGEQHGEEHRPQLGIEGPEARLQREHGRGRRWPARMA